MTSKVFHATFTESQKITQRRFPFKRWGDGLPWLHQRWATGKLPSPWSFLFQKMFTC